MRSNNYKYFLNTCFLFILMVSSTAWADWKTDLKNTVKNGGILVEDPDQNILFSHRANEGFMPASTVKVITSDMALSNLGKDFRSPTDFFVTSDKTLAIKGYGDPFLTSEELQIIADNLVQNGLKKVQNIILDVGFFDPSLVTLGASKTSNPYNAFNGALIANFNTVYVQKNKDGSIVSAEKQTPLTPTAIARAKKMGPGKQRVNLGPNTRIGAVYAAEILIEFLKEKGIPVGGTISFGEIPGGAQKIYRHQSSQTLSEILKGLLEYSTNFSANQLYLMMGAFKLGAPATHEKSQKVLHDFLTTTIGWKHVELYEGAGLSRRNSISPEQMMMVLRHFEKNADLLPIKEKLFRAKTGTLTGVNTLAGYFRTKDGKKYNRFVIFINDTVPHNYRYQIARKIYNGVNGVK